MSTGTYQLGRAATSAISSPTGVQVMGGGGGLVDVPNGDTLTGASMPTVPPQLRTTAPLTDLVQQRPDTPSDTSSSRSYGTVVQPLPPGLYPIKVDQFKLRGQRFVSCG